MWWGLFTAVNDDLQIDLLNVVTAIIISKETKMSTFGLGWISGGSCVLCKGKQPSCTCCRSIWGNE